MQQPLQCQNKATRRNLHSGDANVLERYNPAVGFSSHQPLGHANEGHVAVIKRWDWLGVLFSSGRSGVITRVLGEREKRSAALFEPRGFPCSVCDLPDP